MSDSHIFTLIGNYNSRCSCRSFKSDEIDAVILNALLESALHSASGGNLQPFSIITVKNPESRQLLSDCCRQPFIAEAPVCLIFVLDWYKLSLYARSDNAPFTANLSFDYNLTAYADIMCAMQRIETLANSFGLGSCFIGNILGSCGRIKEHFALPDMTYPIMLMPIGYPSRDIAPRRKLPMSSMVFEERYPVEAMEYVLEGFRSHYGGEEEFILPKEPNARFAMLEEIRKAMLTCYTDAEADSVVEKAEQEGKVSNIIWRFCLKYKAHTMAEDAAAIKADFEAQNIIW